MFNSEQQEIYARYKNPENSGHLEKPHFSLDGSNVFCGDLVHLEGCINERGELTTLMHTSQACAICTAATDLLPELYLGKTIQEIKSSSSKLITDRLGIPLSPTRLKCALLGLETLKQAEVK